MGSFRKLKRLQRLWLRNGHDSRLQRQQPEAIGVREGQPHPAGQNQSRDNVDPIRFVPQGLHVSGNDDAVWDMRRHRGCEGFLYVGDKRRLESQHMDWHLPDLNFNPSAGVSQNGH